MADPREHGLIFTAWSMRRLLDGAKTATRRPITRTNSYVDGYRVNAETWARLDFSRAWVDPGPSPAGNPGPYLKVPMREESPVVDGESAPARETVHRVYPRWQVGDLVWAREAWAPVPWLSGAEKRSPLDPHDGVRYRATWTKTHGAAWRSPIFMPRWAARYVAEVVAAKPQRVSDIAEGEARLEGAEPNRRGAPQTAWSMDGGASWHSTARSAFGAAWAAMHGDGSSSCGWAWALSLRRSEGSR